MRGIREISFLFILKEQFLAYQVMSLKMVKLELPGVIKIEGSL